MFSSDGFDESKYRPILISKKEMNELKEYFEMGDTEIFEKATKLLYDILQAEKLGWRFGFMKIKYELDRPIFDTRYEPNVLPIGIEKIAPSDTRVNYEAFEELKIKNFFEDREERLDEDEEDDFTW